MLFNFLQEGWEGFRGESSRELIFRVYKKFQSKRLIGGGEIELEVLLVSSRNNYNKELDSSKSDVIKIRGCPYYRSCTIYKNNSIMAQVSIYPSIKSNYYYLSPFVIHTQLKSSHIFQHRCDIIYVNYYIREYVMSGSMYIAVYILFLDLFQILNNW